MNFTFVHGRSVKWLDILSMSLASGAVLLYILHSTITGTVNPTVVFVTVLLAGITLFFMQIRPVNAKYAVMIGVDFIMVASMLASGLTISTWVLVGCSLLLRKISIIRNAVLDKQQNHLLFKLQFQATHDALTHCGNRQMMEDLGIQFSHDCSQMAMISVDLDDFKSVNDRYGHDVGDHVLKITSSRIEEAVRTQDRVIRSGGDEFAVMLPNASQDVAERVAARILATVNLPFTVPNDHDQKLHITASAGVAAGGCDNIEGLLRDADRRQYASKESGKDQVTTES